MTEFSAEDREAICETFGRLLARECSEEALRKVIAADAGFDRSLWAQMGGLGLTGLMISPDYGGVGGSIEEVEAIMEVAGASLYNGPYISSCVIAPMLLSKCSDKEFAASHLQNIANGHSIFAVAGCGSSGDWTAPPEVNVNMKNELTGEAGFVVHARNADACLVYANQDDELGVYLVKTGGEGVTVNPHSSDDQTLRLSSMFFENAPAQKLEGFQFGQPIGRFQALKHMAADLLVEVENASSAACHSARALAARSPAASVLTYLAAFTCADNYRHVAAEAIQLHGGIAYTMEHPAHLYWRRAQTGQWLFGSSDTFRETYLSLMEITL